MGNKWTRGYTLIHSDGTEVPLRSDRCARKVLPRVGPVLRRFLAVGVLVAVAFYFPVWVAVALLLVLASYERDFILLDNAYKALFWEREEDDALSEASTE